MTGINWNAYISFAIQRRFESEVRDSNYDRRQIHHICEFVVSCGLLL